MASNERVGHSSINSQSPPTSPPRTPSQFKQKRLEREIVSGDLGVFSRIRKDKSGYLIKMGQIRKSWKKRFFICNGDLLFYFKNEKELRKPKGVINLNGGTVEPNTDDIIEKKASFGMQIPQSFTKDKEYHHRLYYFVAKNEEERREWIEILGRYCLDDNLRPVLFFDPLIGSSRALLLYIYLNKIQIGMRALNLKIEPKVIPKDFLELSPTKIVPLLNIKNENKKFVGSLEIWKYLSEKFKVKFWYPEDSNLRNSIEKMISWSNSTLQEPIQELTDLVVFKRMQTYGRLNQTLIDNNLFNQLSKKIETALLHLEQNLLPSNPQFVCGSVLTFADVCIVCELVNLKLCKFDLSPFPLIKNYINSTSTSISEWEDVYFDFEKLLNDISFSLTPRVIVLGAHGIISKHILQFLYTLAKDQIQLVTTVRKLDVNDISFLKNAGLGEENVISRVNFDDPSTYETAFNGSDKLVLITGNTYKMVEQSKKLVDIAEKVAIRHIIKLSIINADTQNNITTIGAWHKDVESYIQSKGCFKYTFVRSNLFMSSITQFHGETEKKEGTLKLPFDNVKLSWVHPQDVSLAITKILLNSQRYENKIYNLTGPQALSGTELASIISETTHKKYSYVSIPSAEATKKLSELNYEPQWKEALISFYEQIKKSPNQNSSILQDLETLIGKSPSTFAEYVSANSSQFL